MTARHVLGGCHINDPAPSPLKGRHKTPSPLRERAFHEKGKEKSDVARMLPIPMPVVEIEPRLLAMVAGELRCQHSLQAKAAVGLVETADIGYYVVSR